MLVYKIKNMKVRNYIYILLAGVITLASCKKSFLDEENPTAVAVESSITTETGMLTAVSGMYTSMKSYTLFGRNIPVLGDLLADNSYVSITNSGRYLTENNYTYIATTSEIDEIWSQAYNTILQANRILYATVPASDNVNQLRGEAYATRALVYLQLVNLYGQPYTVSPSAAGVPVVTQPTYATGAFSKPARSTVSAVYDRIITDLDSAYLLMPATTPAIHDANSNFLSKYAAKAIEARAYLYKGDYANARDAALLVANNGGYSLAASSSAFSAYWASATNRTDKLETIFELNMSGTVNNGYNGLDAIYNQDGYGDILCTDDLYNSYAATDYRKALILDSTRTPYQAYVVNKYQNVLQSDRDEVKVVRYAEVLLTLAESYARLGDSGNALIYLNRVAQLRDPSLTAYVATGDVLIANIMNERRKELAFEGYRFFDLTRTAAVINRPQEGAKSAASTATISTTNTRRILPIPQVEINANSNITQNPGY
jgi:hypothetical protein